MIQHERTCTHTHSDTHMHTHTHMGTCILEYTDYIIYNFIYLITNKVTQDFIFYNNKGLEKIAAWSGNMAGLLFWI